MEFNSENLISQVQDYFRNSPKQTVLSEFIQTYPSLGTQPQNIAMAFAKLYPTYKLVNYVFFGLDLNTLSDLDVINDPFLGVIEI